MENNKVINGHLNNQYNIQNQSPKIDIKTEGNN